MLNAACHSEDCRLALEVRRETEDGAGRITDNVDIVGERFQLERGMQFRNTGGELDAPGGSLKGSPQRLLPGTLQQMAAA